MVFVVAAIVLVAYVLGSIPFGLIVAKSQGIDIRKHGSGNIGATNVWRVMGKKWGLITFAADMGKGLLAVLAAKWIAAHWSYTVTGPHGPGEPQHLAHDFAGIAAALGCILGHSFPIWLAFKGGKGVATSLGVIIGMMPFSAVVDFVLWGAVFWISGYVSLASIVAAVALPVIVVGLLMFGLVHGWGNFFFAVAAGGLVVWRHRENIKRLVAGTENSFRKPPPPPGSGTLPPPPPPPPAQAS
jgi:glycerol-3-phosphate acyltransferase PlsY